MERKKSLIGGSVPSSNNTIKGLQLFIADLRASQQSQEHEKRIQSEIVKIKQQFESASKKSNSEHDKLGGYQRKKYIAKLAYIYITSNTTKLNEILFGLDQAIELLRSSVFSEKFVGYMTLELLYEHKIVIEKINDKVMPQLINDLTGNNDHNTGLALNFIGVVGNLTNQFAFNEELVSEVFQILRSPTSSQYLKRKSALTFLTLLKNNLSILTDDLQRKQLWIQRILSLLDDSDNYRLTLVTLPLVQFIAENIDSSYCTRLIPQLSEILYNCVVLGTSQSRTNQFPTEYVFANMPNPWLITKVVSLLNALIKSPRENTSGEFLEPNNMDPETLGKLRMCVMEALKLGRRRCNDPLEKVVQNTVLFSLINFAPKLDPSPEAIINSVNALCALLGSAEINVRYLSLDSLVKLCSLSGKVAIDAVRHKNLDLIFHLLINEKDSSIVRKVVDLLYIFTDVDNVKVIVDQLLNYVLNARNVSDPHIKSDISVKIAILTEKFATDTNWYVNISLKLLSLSFSSSFNDDEIWQRLCQIVVNNPSLHKITAAQLVGYLQENHTSEALVKTSAFILGEYGNLLYETISIPELFNLFTDKYFISSNATKAMILTTIIQLYKFQPGIVSGVIKFFQLELNSIDIELQTRSYEYLKIIQITKMSGNNNLLDALLEPIPPFNSKSNPLLKRLGNLVSTADNTLVATPTGSSGPSFKTSNNTGSNSSLSQFVPIPPQSRIRSNTHDSYYGQQMLSSNWREGFARMLLHKQGIFYISPLIKIIYRIQIVQSTQLQISLTYVNSTEWDINGLSTEVIPVRSQGNPEYVIQNNEVPSSSSIPPNKRVDQKFQIVIRRPFSVEEAPIINIHFRCGGSTNTLKLKLGVGITATLSNENRSSVTLAQFITRWKTLGEALGKDAEYQVEGIKIKHDSNKLETDNMDTALSLLRQNLTRIGFDLIDQNNVPSILFSAGIIHTKSDGNFGCLVKVQYLKDSKINITCKTTTPGPLAKCIVECIKAALSG